MWVIQMITHRKEKLVELCDSGIFSSNRNLETVKKKHISEELIYRAALFIASRHREAYSAGVFFSSGSSSSSPSVFQEQVCSACFFLQNILQIRAKKCLVARCIPSLQSFCELILQNIIAPSVFYALHVPYMLYSQMYPICFVARCSLYAYCESS